MSNFKSNNKFDVFNKEREKEYDNKPKYNQFKSYSSSKLAPVKKDFELKAGDFPDLAAPVITNTTANQVYISIGSSSGATDVANTILVPANDFIVIQSSAIFSSSATQTLYLHSVNWNSSSLNLIMIFLS